MALHHRHDRQLMRQRGAGSRTIASTDFGLDFGFASSRDDRQQMRQRGAGRKAEPANFGLSFQTPSRNARLSTKTPTSAVYNTSRSTRASAQRQRETLSQPLRATSTSSQHGKPGEATTYATEIPSIRSSKRRKVSRERSGSIAINDTPEPLRPLANNSRRRSSRATFSIAEDDHLETADISAPNTPIRQSIEFPMSASQHEKENQIPIGTQSKRQQSTQRRFSLRVDPSSRPAQSTLPDLANAVASSQANTGLQDREESVLDSRDSYRLHGGQQGQEGDSSGLQEAPHLPMKKRKKRKSIVLGKKKRKSSETSMPTNERSITPAPEPQLVEVVEVPHRRTRVPSKDPTPRSSPTSEVAWGNSHAVHASDDEDEDGEYVDKEHTPEPPTPAPARRSRKGLAAQQRLSGDSNTGTKTKPGMPKSSKQKSTFPIVTHRMTRFTALPTVEEEKDPAEPSLCDEESVNFCLTDKPIPNAIDVLAQICRETISNTDEQVSTKDNSRGNRADIRRKRSALEAFGHELETRLFDMSAAVENRAALESRVRKTKRQHADLQARWMEIRKERERVALSCDRIRRQHWEDEYDAEERWRISEAAHKVELEIEKDGDQEPEAIGLEYLLRTTVEDISNLSSSGGVLHQVQTFNAQLEKIAEILELA